MGFEYSIHPGENLIRMRCEGEFYAGDLFAHTERVNADPLFRPGMDTLGDYREAEFADDASAMADILRQTESLSKIRGKCRWAVIAPDSDFIRMVKLFAMVTKKRGAGIESRAFRTEEEAMAWILSGRENS